MRSTVLCALLAWAPVSLACDCMALPLLKRVKLSSDVFLAITVVNAARAQD